MKVSQTRRPELLLSIRSGMESRSRCLKSPKLILLSIWTMTISFSLTEILLLLKLMMVGRLCIWHGQWLRG